MIEKVSHTYNIKRAVLYAILIYLAVVIVSLKNAPHYAPFVALVIVLLPLFAILVINYSHVAILCYICFLPIIQHFSYISILEFGKFLVTPHMVVQFLLTLSFVIKALKDYQKKEIQGINILDKQIISFGSFSLLSLIYSYGLPVDQEKKWLLFYTGIIEPISFYFIVTYYLKKFSEFKKQLILAFLFTSFTSLVVAFSEFNHIGYNLVKIFLSRMHFGYGYHNINLFGIQSAVLFPVAFYAMVSEEFRKYRAYAYSSFVVLTVLSILCFNRGTFIVMTIQLFFMFFNKSNRKIIYVFLIIAIIIGVYFNDLVAMYFTRFIGGKGATSNNPLLDASALYRLEAWKLGFNLLWQYPFGVGPGGFQMAWARYGPYPNVYMGTPHHLFLSIGVDYGLLALIVFISLLLSAYQYLKGMVNVEREDSQLIKLILISIIGFVIYGAITDGELSHLTGFTYPNNGYTLIFFSVIALASNIINKYKANG
ncbi:MAG: O-antigen ligase family protein [archaeon]